MYEKKKILICTRNKCSVILLIYEFFVTKWERNEKKTKCEKRHT